MSFNNNFLLFYYTLYNINKIEEKQNESIKRVCKVVAIYLILTIGQNKSKYKKKVTTIYYYYYYYL